MSIPVEIAEWLLPEEHRGKWRFDRADLVKFGFLALRVPEVNDLAAGKIAFGARVLPAIQAMHDTLKAQPEVLQIEPARPAAVAERTSLSGLTSSLTLENPFRLQVKILPSRREQLVRGAADTAPETFSILFDGSLFGVMGTIDRVPVRSSLGQLARELLRVTFSNDEKSAPFISPTPMHTDLYLIAAKAIDTDVPTAVPAAIPCGKDVILLYDPAISAEQVLLAIWPEARRVLNSFYDARYVAEDLDEQIISINKMNDALTKLLAEFFEHSHIAVIVQRRGRTIRRMLARMHIALQSLSSDRLALARWRKYLHEMATDNWLFRVRSAYFEEESAEHFALDLDAQLRFMEYAASETTNAAIIQATLWAGVVGAVIGGAMALLAK